MEHQDLAMPACDAESVIVHGFVHTDTMIFVFLNALKNCKQVYVCFIPFTLVLERKAVSIVHKK